MRITSLLCVITFALAGVAFGDRVQDDLVEACAKGDLTKVRKLLVRPDRSNQPDQQGRSPLLVAISSRNEKLVAFLLEKGADPNAEARCIDRGCPRHPALPYSVYIGEPGIVKRLLQAGADVSWRDHQVTRNANRERKVDIFRLLKAAGGREWSTPTEAGASEPENNAARVAPPMGLAELLPGPPVPSKDEDGKLRFAVLPDGHMAGISDLLTAELTTAGLDVVERAELDRLIAERNLTNDLAADASRSREIASLIGADVLLLTRKGELQGTGFVEVRVVRVSPGLIVHTSYAPWPLPDAPGWASNTAAHVQRLSKRLTEKRGIALSPADFRPATNTPEAVALSRDAALLVADGFLRRPEVILLERSAVSEMVQERQITGGGQFWQGSFLVDGTAESALDGSGRISLSLRLQPVAGGKPISFTAQGNRGDLPKVVGELVEKSAGALSLHAAAEVLDPAAEARRYFEESRIAHASSLFLTAYRHAETASALGYKSDEFTKWRLDAALALIAWQGKRMASLNSFDEALDHGWHEAWMNRRLGGTEWLKEAEWLEAGRQVVELWRTILIGALKSGDADRVRSAIEQGKFVTGAALATYATVNTSAGMLKHSAQLEGITRELGTTLREAADLAAADPVMGEAHSELAKQIANLATVLFPKQTDLSAVVGDLLARKYTHEPVKTRVALLQSFARTGSASALLYEKHGGGFGSVARSEFPTENPGVAPAALMATIRTSKAVEDLLTMELLRFRSAATAKDRVAISEKVFAMISDHQEYFIKEPEALGAVHMVTSGFMSAGQHAPKFANLNRSRGGGRIQHTPEMLALRRRLFLSIAEKAENPGPAMLFFDRDYHPPGEDLEELNRLQRKVSASYGESRMPVRATVSKPTSARPPLAATPTYEGNPALRVNRWWNARMHGKMPHWSFYLHSRSAVVADGDLWIYGEVHGDSDTRTTGYVFRVKLPSMETEIWPMPEQTLRPTAREKLGSALLVEPENIFVARYGAFLATGNRRTKYWESNTDLHPSGSLLRRGNDLFFLTESDGARGFAKYRPDTKTAELLASNRRVPAITPLDQPNVRAVSMKDEGEEIRFALYESEEGEREKHLGSAGFNPANGAWSEVQPPAPSAPGGHVFVPLEQPGPATAYRKGMVNQVWTLQLPRPEMPKARIPFEFAAEGHEGGTGDPKESRPFMAYWYWTGNGYAVFEQGGNPHFWFIPVDELNQYLDTHTPKADETSSAPPRPSVSASN